MSINYSRDLCISVSNDFYKTSGQSMQNRTLIKIWLLILIAFMFFQFWIMQMRRSDELGKQGLD